MRVFLSPKCSALGQDSFCGHNPQDYCPTKRHLAGIKKLRVYLQTPTYINSWLCIIFSKSGHKKGAEWPLLPKLKTKNKSSIWYAGITHVSPYGPGRRLPLRFRIIDIISTSQEFSVPHGIMLHPTISKNRCFAPTYFLLAEKISLKENPHLRYETASSMTVT